MKKLFLIVITMYATISNIFALDIYGSYEVEGNVVLNEDVHVHPGGVVYNKDNSWWSLTINGNLTNEGTIQDNSQGYGLEIYPTGNITNTGTISCYRVRVQGSVQQSISSSGTISSPYFTVTNSLGMVATGNISFSNTDVDFNNYPLDLTGGYGIVLDDGVLREAIVTGITTSEINLSNTAYLYDVDITDCSLNGIVEVASLVNLYGDVTNNGVLQNYSSSPYDITAHGNLINYGTIRDNSVYSLTVDSYGNIINYGIWNNYRLDLIGTSPQTLSLYNSAVFNTEYLTNSNTTSIISGTDLSFQNTAIDFNDYDLDLSAGHSLFVDGGYLYMANIIGSGTTSVDLSNSAYLNDIDMTNCDLNGVIEINGDSVWMYGNVKNEGIIQNKSNSNWCLNIGGNLVNNGTIRNNPGGSFLDVDCYGNIVNNGMWIFDDLDLTGTSIQTISSTNGSVFSCYSIESLNSNGIIAGSDLDFSNCRIDFNDNDLDLSIGYNMFVDGEYIYMTNIIGSSTSFLDMSNSAYLDDVDLTDFTLSGTIEINGDAVWMYGEINNNGIIENKSNSNWKLNVDANLTNNGAIRNSPDGSSLTIDLYKNITNAGVWTNYYTQLVGTADQNILLMNNSSFQNHWFSMWSEFTTGPLQWYYNGSILDSPDFSGETGTELYTTDAIVDSTFVGTYYCDTGDGPSRNIFISSIIYESPNITSVVNNGSNVVIDWDNIASAISYKVFSSEDPNTLTHLWTYETEVFTNSCSISNQTEQKKFYFVKAVY